MGISISIEQQHFDTDINNIINSYIATLLMKFDFHRKHFRIRISVQQSYH
jgi:hypothetical protein